MGYALAKVAFSKGYQVSLVSGPTDLRPPKGVKFYPVVSALQMKRTCEELFPSHDGLIMTAAVCDFMPAAAVRHKIPSAKGLTLKLKRTPDILAALAKQKGRRVVIGFCLETCEEKTGWYRGEFLRPRQDPLREKTRGGAFDRCGWGRSEDRESIQSAGVGGSFAMDGGHE
jgi:phosphopantothenoylcysteine synthetase/decarboxylase